LLCRRKRIKWTRGFQKCVDRGVDLFCLGEHWTGYRIFRCAGSQPS
jgi:hypothetical protein